MPTPETPITVDETTIAEIESRSARVNTRFEELIILTPAERDALCATVKHLRARHEQLALASGEWATLLDRIRAWSKCKDGYPLDEHINNIIVDRERLQSQLEQLRAENERLQSERDGFEGGLNYTVAMNRHLSNNDADKAVQLFRSRAIQLCKDKAAVHDMHCGTQFTANADCDCAAKQFLVLATELEKL